jgi:DNA-binding response OmpR family regulator
MKEFELLKYLMENPREVLTREQILENVWGYDFLGESNVIEVYIRYLRLKIRPLAKINRTGSGAHPTRKNNSCGMGPRARPIN